MRFEVLGQFGPFPDDWDRQTAHKMKSSVMSTVCALLPAHPPNISSRNVAIPSSCQPLGKSHFRAPRSSPLVRSSRTILAMATPAAATDVKPKVSLLGIGLMGNKMARRLRDVGFDVTAWNRTPSKAQPLTEAGVRVAPSAADAVASGDVILLMLSDADAIRATLLDDAATQGKLKGKTVVQMGTIGPAQAKAIAAEVLQAGAHFLEAPVLGSQPEASAGTLLVMVGAEGDPKESKAWPVLQAFGSKITHMGEVGTGAAAKLALNQLISSLTIGFSTSLAMVQKNDVDLDKFMGILRESALYAPTYDKKLSKYISREYGAANFPTKHLLKDTRLFAEEAGKVQCDTSFLKAMEGIIENACLRGFADSDYSAVYDAVMEPVKPGESVTPEM